MEKYKFILEKLNKKETINYKEIAESSNHFESTQDVKNFFRTLQNEGYVRNMNFSEGGIGNQVIVVFHDNAEITPKGKELLNS